MRKMAYWAWREAVIARQPPIDRRRTSIRASQALRTAQNRDGSKNGLSRSTPTGPPPHA